MYLRIKQTLPTYVDATLRVVSMLRVKSQHSEAEELLKVDFFYCMDG